MRYSEQVLEEVRTGNDIVDFISFYVRLTPKGNSYFGLCPFHKERTPSFSVSADKQLYYCFGCGATGNVYNFAMQMENLTFFEAIVYLADRINYTLPEESYNNEKSSNNISKKKNTLYEIHKIAARYYYQNLQTKEGKIAVDYLNERKILLSIRKAFGLGYSLSKRDDIYLLLKEKGFADDIILESGLVLKDRNNKIYDRFSSRIMFPIIDKRKNIIGFGGRIVNQNDNKSLAKYLNSPDTLIFNKSQNLYGINLSKTSKSNTYIIVEGYLDVISLHQAGFKNVVGVLGTAFNQNHVKAIKTLSKDINLILLFDSDEAGINAALRAIPILKKERLNSKIMQLKGAKDPDEYINKFGKEAFEDEILKAKDYISFEIEQKLKDYNLSDLFQRINFTKEVAKIISNLDSFVEREVFINKAAEITGISFNTISDEIDKINVKNLNIENKESYKINYHSKNSNKVEEAQKSIINILVNYNYVYNKLKDVLSPDEFLTPFYKKLANIIYNLNKENKNITPASLVNYFETIDEQKKVSELFVLQINFDDSKLIKKIVNDEVKIIKEAYIEEKIQNIKDIEELNILIKQKKNIKDINLEI